MTDEELIARLRDEHVSASRTEAADRIEALVKEQNYWIERCGRERAFASSHRVRAERLEALLREARTDLEDYVTQEYPKHAHPYFERQWNRDMELCRRIDAALKGEDHDG